MKIVSREDDEYVISLAVGDEIIAELKKFAEKEIITGASFNVIGLTSEVELGAYSVDSKEYQTSTWSEPMEIATITGNVAVDEDDEIVVHAHGIFSGKDFDAMGGHIMRAVIGAAGEVVIKKYQQPLKRKYNDGLGLKTFD